jgi:hypothetical protein
VELSGAAIGSGEMFGSLTVTPAIVEVQKRLATYGRHIRWTEPTEPGGAWLVEVLDEQGHMLDGGMGDDPQDALLEVAERLLPPEGTA